jgi:ribosome maturation factor RimP
VSNSRTDATKEQVTAVLVDPLAALGLDLEAVELTPAGKRRVLRIAVDKDGGVSMDDVAEATRAVGEILDESPIMGEMAYTLEVTSRGVERPLTLQRHWRRNITRMVKVSLVEEGEFTGRIAAAGDESATVTVDGEDRDVPYADVAKALVQIEFNRKAGPAGEEDND